MPSLIDWERFRPLLSDLYTNTEGKGGLLIFGREKVRGHVFFGMLDEWIKPCEGNPFGPFEEIRKTAYPKKNPLWEKKLSKAQNNLLVSCTCSPGGEDTIATGMTAFL